MRAQHRQAGFTLVEISIVLIIVGLLLGGVLKGQEMVFNSRVKALYSMSRELSAATYAYQDRYRQLPGDDPAAASRFPAASPLPTSGNGSATLDWQTWPCTPTSTGENCQYFYHLRLAGMIQGAGADAALSPFNRMIGVASRGTFITGGGVDTLALGLPNYSHKVVSALDTSFDDGDPNTGTVRCSTITSYDMANPDSSTPAWCVIAF